MQRQKSASSCGRNVSIQMRKKTKGENNIKAKYVIRIIEQFIQTAKKLTIILITDILKPFCCCRLGFNEQPSRIKDTEEEVNEYLGRAIDARSIDRLRSEHCKRFFLTFRDSAIEAKFSKEKDKVLQAYFVCSFIVFLSLFELQRNILPR